LIDIFGPAIGAAEAGMYLIRSPEKAARITYRAGFSMPVPLLGQVAGLKYA